MRLYSIDGWNDGQSDRLFQIDRLTRTGTVVGSTGVNWNHRYLCVHPVTGVLYGGTDDKLYRVDRTSGLATLVGTYSGAPRWVSALAIDSNGAAYIANVNGNGASLYHVDLATAHAVLIGSISTGFFNGFDDLAFDPRDVLYGAHRDGNVYAIDVGTAATTLLFPGRFEGLAFVTVGSDCNANAWEDDVDIAIGDSDDCNENGVPDECEPDCQPNGLADECDLRDGSSADCNSNGVPDECESDCQPNGVADQCDISIGTSRDCNANIVPDECEADCQRNGRADECDIADGSSADCDRNNVPDECDPDCQPNGQPDACDIQLGTSLDCNRNRVPDECDVNSTPDCNHNGIPDACEKDCQPNGIPDDCDLASATSEDCNGNARPDECEPDCNDNDVPDDCDVDTGTSENCNGNRIPDECEFDCNMNAVPDDCDLAAGTSQDENGNGHPDECEPSNDLCDDAIAVGEGDFRFSGVGVTSDGPPADYICGVFCDPWPCYFPDVWYNYLARCSGMVEVDARSESNDPLTVIIYEGCDCPVDVENFSGCRFWSSSPLLFGTMAGTCYKIQVAASPTSGTLTIRTPDTCVIPGPNGDYDLDADADLDDFYFWPTCMMGPSAGQGSADLQGCSVFDREDDGDVDLGDLGGFLAHFQAASSVRRYVPSAYSTIQAAIDVAVNGDTVVVAPGIYHENLRFNGKLVTVTGTAPGDAEVVAATILHGTSAGPVVTFVGSETADARLIGFTITGGFAPQGGGIRCSGAKPVIRNCSIVANRAGAHGGGLYDCDGTIANCTIAQNYVDFGFGGGLNNCDGNIHNCIIQDNASRFGAGLYECDGVIQGCSVIGNAANVSGGGIAFCDGTITRCRVSGNSAGNSGGALYNCSATVRDCVVSGNSAALSGGGFDYCDGAINNVTIVGNRTTSTNFGGAVANSSAAMTGCILWDNTNPFWYYSFPYPTYSAWPGTPFDGNIIDDPQFVSPGHWDDKGRWTEGDYHLSSVSPCIDAGDPGFAPAFSETDLDGKPRISRCRVDMGAYEVQFPGPQPDCNGPK
ncbi:MAG: choice-of-anchor Q domain-containing protein [Planctomycetota bacterium]